MNTDFLNPEPLKLTLIPFQNVEETEPVPGYEGYGVRRGTGKWSKKPSIMGAFTEYEYGSVHTVDDPRGHEVIGYPTGLAQEAVQVGVVCTPLSGLLVIDVDDPEAYDDSDLGTMLPLELAYTRRGEGGHIYLDMRHVPREKWPTQGPIRGGDIKSAGYVAAAGSLHYSGDRYERTGNPVLVVTDEEVEYLLEAKRQATGSSRPGAYRGDGHGDDDHLARSVYGWVFEGLAEDEVHQRWQELADEIQDLSWPFTGADFRRHYRGAARKYESSQVTEVVGSNLSPENGSLDLRDWLPTTSVTRLDALTKPWTPHSHILRDRDQILAKVKAENDPDRWSQRDWNLVPEGGREVFTRVGTLKADGIDTPLDAEWIVQSDPTGEIRQWIQCADWVMAEVDGVLEVLRDRRIEADPPEICVCGSKVVWKNFAGADPNFCPHVGHRWSREDRLDTVEKAYLHLAAIARKQTFGRSETPEDRPDSYAGVSYVNRHLRGHRKPMSASQYRTTLTELEEAGRLVKIRKARYFRSDHAWQTAPALYADAAEYPHLVKPDLSTAKGIREHVHTLVELHRAEYPGFDREWWRLAA